MARADVRISHIERHPQRPRRKIPFSTSSSSRLQRDNGGVNPSITSLSPVEATETRGAALPGLSEESIRAYVSDYECLMDGVSFFLGLQQRIAENKDISPIREHYEAHPEDKLCEISHPKDRGTLLCTRAGIDAIHRISKRLIEEAPNGVDLSSKAIAETISERIAQVILDQVTDDHELVRILKSYVSLTETEHASITHHIPCVIMRPLPNHEIAGGPLQDTFVLSPVTFQHSSIFLERLRTTEASKESSDERTVKYFSEAAERHGWVASVTIPSCAPDVSRKRAEDVIETAINSLKVFIGLGYARSMRLPHVSAARDRETCILTERDGEFSWTWYGRGMQGASVRNDWFANLPQDYRNLASYLLHACLFGKRTEAANRLVDALKWFGDASFEESCGVKISKWIAALERLTTTAHFNTHTFCVRIALLTSDLDAISLDRSYRDARTAYQLRCDVMHGSRSQDNEHFAVNERLVHDLTRTSLFRALEIHHYLSAVAGDAELPTIESFFQTQAKRFETQFETLRQEFSGKRKQPKN
jgi:hypothetical protein